MVDQQRVAEADTTGVRYAESNGLKLAYETFGPEDGEPLLLIMGLSTQMLGWPEEFCLDLAAAGHRVVRFDNRDIGLSTHLDDANVPGPTEPILHPKRVPYSIDDMADDAAGLMAALGWESAHVVGASMGGFIAQALAIRHPRRARSLTLIMTSTGSRRVGRPRIALAARLARPRAATDRQEAVDAVVRTFRLIGSPGYPFDEENVRAVAEASYDRAYDPAGYQRQLAACLAQTNRTRDLRRLQVPTVVVHGLSDPLVTPSGGLALARAIPGAYFVGLGGMGHDLPRPLWGRVRDEIVAVARRAG